MKIPLFYSKDTPKKHVFSTPPGSGEIVVTAWYPKKAGKKPKNFIEVDIPDDCLKTE